ncbi:hypothetical protein N0V88_002984 [Collariella sp. IMI 366227]|nr:hypothetical protein N0V88_002984 [Collariella sp. IMI 366227]
MERRYSPEFLLHLRQSPLCVKPPTLPPAEEWMGPPPETFRNQQKTTTDRPKGGDSLLLNNQDTRRPPHDRNGSRTSTNPDEITFGPPRTSFASATSMRNARPGETERVFRDSERQDRTDRFNFPRRTTDQESAGGDRFGRDARAGRNNGFARRGDQDQDSEGWSTVKPRKSFGHEGAERFHGRMGGVGSGNDRFPARDDRRVRDRDDRESAGERRTRNVDHRSRDLEGEEPETPRRNGPTRGKSESWREGGVAITTNDTPMTQRERIDRAKSWRDREPEEKPSDRYGDRNDRNHDRRWDRDRHGRVENDPEWLDEPAEEKTHGHTEEDFKKFMERMKAGSAASRAEEKKPSMAFDKPPAEVIEPEQKVVSAPAVEQGPDKFFAAYGSSGLDVGTPTAEVKDTAKPKGGKSSRFMAFLTPQEDNRARTEPPTPAAVPQFGDNAAPPQQTDADKEAFNLLIQKLQLQRMGMGQANNPPPLMTPNRYPEINPFQEMQQKSAVASPEPFQQYGANRRDDPRMHTPQHSLHDIISPRPVGIPVPPPQVSRPEQALQDLLAQRHHLPNPNSRADQNLASVNRNKEFLMGLMQSHRDAPEPPRTEQLLLRMPQPTKQVSLANVSDREQDYQRERSASQRQQQMRGQGGPPGFLDDSQFHPGDMDSRPPPQPTQILQRPPPPPGLDHQMHPFHMGGVNPVAAAGAQMGPQRPMIPPQA